jgi:hypothetical protein
MGRRSFFSLVSLVLALALMVIVRYTLGFAAPLHQDDGQEYVVQGGDSLYRIAEQFYGNGNSWPVILEATNAKAQTDRSFTTINNPRQLRVGQKVWIPARGDDQSTTATSRPTPTTAPSDHQHASEPGVRFVRPLDGAVVSPTFEVEMAATGLTVEPAGEIREGAGHMHILVDTDFTPPGDVILTDEQHLHFGKAQLTTTLALEPGVHVLRLQFANGAHIALEGEQYRDTITVTVAE